MTHRTTLSIAARIEYEFPEPTDFLLQMEPAIIPEQRVVDGWFECTPTEHFARVAAQDTVGERIWLRHHGEFTATYSAKVTIERLLAPIERLTAVPTHELPGETVQYLMDSRYCPADRFQSFTCAEFGGVHGGTQILAMRDWITGHFEYVAGASDSYTTALDTFVERRGVCRDFAHMLITLARAAAIPARFASVYGPDVNPQDFHAVAEVFLADPELGEDSGGAWHMVDATGMAKPADIAKIGIGRDAADVSFLTSYGLAVFKAKEIEVSRV
ncbi:MAG TPA: transglutaminase family protein [Novosphingobium sp.]|nr:transglutaminase family protein [Novosphingobium sp.]